MPKLLHVQSSPNLTGSITRQLSTEFVEQFKSSHPEFAVELLDLARDPLPHWGPDAIAAFKGLGGERNPAQQAAIDLSERLIRQVEDAAVLVIGCPMYNMSIPTQLKSWIDFLTRAGRTFKPVDRTNFEGLIDGKKIYVILSRGGDYSQAPSSAFDFQEPLVRASLGLLGMNDVNFIRAEGQRLEEAPFYMKSAREAIARLAS